MLKTCAPRERYSKNYDERDIEQAVEAIKKGLSKKQASKEYGIPRATFQFRLSNKFKKTGHGPPPILTQDEEELLKIDNIKENENEDFMKLYQIWKYFDESGKQKHKNEDRESISEEILNIEAMKLFIDDVHIEYIDECTETNENASLENESLNLKLKENRQQTKTKETETETEKAKLTNLVTVPEKSLLYDEERPNSKQFNEKVKILCDIQILPSSRTHVRNLLTVLDGETDKHCQSTLEEQGHKDCIAAIKDYRTISDTMCSVTVKEKFQKISINNQPTEGANIKAKEKCLQNTTTRIRANPKAYLETTYCGTELRKVRLEKAAKEMGLELNQNETKYMARHRVPEQVALLANSQRKRKASTAHDVATTVVVIADFVNPEILQSSSPALSVTDRNLVSKLPETIPIKAVKGSETESSAAEGHRRMCSQKKNFRHQ
ncbi:hypothetical protein ILUMI_11513 [Ignelater luminosus]|uniref:HTH psq-type domain-containing protein n=1 Tax=Ignelater luminosus TaxID=2038154 RepID=A0A8K0GD64_IGNLU|nr:hypothetical protein ILUMI_11513 [Ignelater luminosus]